jgi:paraquat-inducible protein B
VNRPAAARVGFFVLLGLAVLVAAVLWVSRDWLGRTENVQLRFASSVYGLQPGAPVVLRGVRVGQVRSIALDAGGTGVPVRAVLDRAALAPLLPGAPADAELAPLLVQRGLVATLGTQSLLTGLLYVDLSLDPARAAPPQPAGPAPATTTPAATGPTEIPTRTGTLDALQSQLAALDLPAIAADLAEVAAAVRRVMTAPEADQALARASRAAAAVEALAAQLQRDWPPLARQAGQALGSTQAGLQQLGPALAEAGAAARALATAAAAAASSAEGLGREGSSTLQALRRAGDELAEASRQLAGVASADAPLAQDTQRAMGELARAARALRELSELLQRHPDALLRGRQETPP